MEGVGATGCGSTLKTVCGRERGVVGMMLKRTTYLLPCTEEINHALVAAPSGSPSPSALGSVWGLWS